MRSSLRLWFLFDLPDRRPQLINDFSANHVIVLSPHMDDEAIGCGGAIARHVQSGGAVTAVYMTDGRKGGFGGDDNLVARRKEESRKSGAILGISEYVFLDGPDLALTDSPDLVKRTAEIFRDKQPAIVYVPALTDRHPDHWGTNQILRAALDLLPAAQVNQMLIRGYEVWSPVPANRLMDITAQFDLKRQAISQFKTQLSFDYVAAVAGLNQFRALTWQRAKGYAEAFLETTPAEYRRMFSAMLVRERFAPPEPEPPTAVHAGSY